MTNDKSNQLLGELLTEVGLIQVADLREAALIARSHNLPIGKVLVMSGYITKELLAATIEAQARFKDHLLNYDIGIKALKVVAQKNNTLEEALAGLGQTPRPMDTTSNRLGALLLDADLLTKPDIDKALEESKRCGLPLGRVLSNLSLLSDQMVNFALNAQKMLRSGKISKDEAVKSLVGTKGVTLSQGNINAIKKESNKPIEIYADATGRSVVQQTISQQSISQQSKTLEPENKQQPFPELDSLSLHHMLRIAGLIKTEALESAIKDSLENPDVMGIILKRSGLLEEFVIEAAKECCQLISTGQVKPEQAIIALHHCQRTRNSVKECLQEFGWLEKSEAIW